MKKTMGGQKNNRRAAIFRGFLFAVAAAFCVGPTPENAQGADGLFSIPLGIENASCSDNGITAPSPSLFSLPFMSETASETSETRNRQNDFDETILRGNFSSLKISPFAWRAVGNLYGEWNSLDGSGTGTASGFSSAVFGGSIGADRQFGKNIIAGFKLGGADIALDPDDSRYDGNISSFHGLAEMELAGNLWFWNLGVGVGKNRNRLEFPAGGETGSAKRTATQWNYQTELGLRFRRGYTKIEPFFGMRYINLDGAPGDLTADVSRLSDDIVGSVRSMVGSRFHWEYATYIATLKPSLWGAWVHEYNDRSVFTTSDTLDFPVAWRLGDHRLPADRMILGAGMAAALRDMADLWFRYDSTLSGHYSAYTISAGVNLKY